MAVPVGRQYLLVAASYLVEWGFASCVEQAAGCASGSISCYTFSSPWRLSPIAWSKDWWRNERLRPVAEGKLTAELNYLRHQLSPTFYSTP